MYASRVAAAATLLLCALAQPASAQRGLGDDAGVVRQGLDTDRTVLSGTVDEVHTGPCEHTTGRSPLGAHLMLTAENGDGINLHLGPVGALADMLETVEVGDAVTADAFRTDAMPADAYVAVTVTVDEKVFRLRDESLRPLWANGTGRARGPGSHRPRGPGQGRVAGGWWR